MQKFSPKPLEHSGPTLDGEFVCPVCVSLLDHDYVSVAPCQHNFCRDCINQVIRNQEPCPLCRSAISELLSPNVHSDFHVRLSSIPVRCSNIDSGCPWDGLYASHAEHQQSCEFRSIECNHSGCKHTCAANRMEDHAELCLRAEAQCGKCHFRSARYVMARHVCSQLSDSMFEDDQNLVPGLGEKALLNILPTVTSKRKSCRIDMEIPDQNKIAESTSFMFKNGPVALRYIPPGQHQHGRIILLLPQGSQDSAGRILANPLRLLGRRIRAKMSLRGLAGGMKITTRSIHLRSTGEAREIENEAVAFWKLWPGMLEGSGTLRLCICLIVN